MNTKVLLAINSSWNIANFRAGLIRALIASGYDVIATAPPDDHTHRIYSLKCRYFPIPIDNKGTHPARDLLLFGRYFILLLRERPVIYLGYTVKPNIYGAIAAHILRIPVINNIAGLGAVFIKHNWVTVLVKAMYRLALRRSAMVFFQNEDDRKQFIGAGLVNAESTDRLPGSGVDLEYFNYLSLSVYTQRPIRFLLIARMLWDKGVGEYVEAARIVHQRHPHVEFCLLGFLDVPNPAAISRSQMNDWVNEGVIRYLGAVDDVRPHLADIDCVVLPSYREGVPRTLLEAAAMGRPIITTDAVGCREVVEDGVNGFLCAVRDPADLAAKIENMIALSHDQREAMGRRGREKIEREFDERIVIQKYLDAIHKILYNKAK